MTAEESDSNDDYRASTPKPSLKVRKGSVPTPSLVMHSRMPSRRSSNSRLGIAPDKARFENKPDEIGNLIPEDNFVSAVRSSIKRNA